MKYADGPTAEVEVIVHAPLERVWQIVTDIDTPARFSSELLGATWLDAGPAVGARFVGRSHHPAMGEWETTSIVSRYEPMRAFAWNVTDTDNPSSSWGFELEEVEDGVRLRQRGRMGPAPSGLTIAITAMPDKEERIVARRLSEWEANMRATVEGIKQLAEAGR
ncbi:MAG TPA: SRPBCC family protein [Acidimicrobiales bacterium]|nr:SRPBCC family protein [Acidimicrobiales bacterium]